MKKVVNNTVNLFDWLFPIKQLNSTKLVLVTISVLQTLVNYNISLYNLKGIILKEYF